MENSTIWVLMMHDNNTLWYINFDFSHYSWSDQTPSLISYYILRPLIHVLINNNKIKQNITHISKVPPISNIICCALFKEFDKHI